MNLIKQNNILTEMQILQYNDFFQKQGSNQYNI